LVIDSVIGGGTTVELSVPVPAPPADHVQHAEDRADQAAPAERRVDRAASANRGGR
jgi:hypothetical protein